MFVDDEEDRLVLVVVDVIGRETISDDELCDWIDAFGSWLAGQGGAFDPASRPPPSTSSGSSARSTSPCARVRTAGS